MITHAYTILIKFVDDFVSDASPDKCWYINGQLSPFASASSIYEIVSLGTTNQRHLRGATCGSTHKQWGSGQ